MRLHRKLSQPFLPINEYPTTLYLLLPTSLVVIFMRFPFLHIAFFLPLIQLGQVQSLL